MRARTFPHLLVCAALVLIALVAPTSAQSRLAFAEYEIAGPFAGVVLDAGLAGTTTVEGTLRAGESRRVWLPIPTSPGAPPLEPRAVSTTVSTTVSTSESREPNSVTNVRFLRWRERDERLANLSPPLRARPAPVADSVRVRVGLAVLALLAAAFVAGLAILRYVLAAFALAIAASAVAFHLARHALDRDAPAIEVLDGYSGFTEWRRARAARDTLVLPASTEAFDLVVEPGRAALAITTGLDPTPGPRATCRGAVLTAISREPWPADVLEPTANRLAPLAAVWVRDEGEWTFRGPWDLDAPLGPAIPGVDPPGWLVAGLPQGTRLVVGELQAGASGGKGVTYVRSTLP